MLDPEGYAKLSYGGQPRLHRHLMGHPRGMDVDHINGDRLDNRRKNLRVVTRSVNNMNSNVVRAASGYKGVGLHRSTGLFYARLKVGGKTLSLGYHRTPELANIARLLKEREVFGIQPRRLPAFQQAGLA